MKSHISPKTGLPSTAARARQSPTEVQTELRTPQEEFLDLVPTLLAARGPDGALVSKFAVAFNVSCARWAAAYDVREEFRDNGCQLRPGT